MLFFRIALLSLSGIVTDVLAAGNLDRALLHIAPEQFDGESIHRLLATPDSREFGTHVSTVDLLGLWVSMPAATLRFWFGLSTNAS